MEEEYFFDCPYCWQEISMLIDTASGNQTYIEDCEICCNPIEISYQVAEEQVVSFEARRLE
ncbi:MAG: CPXCG motif-containing cysteine-rich protein [Anaerolineae bacterium]|nr:CPXCG motif-containing cysteine-rich protein [Anaerolineae bacterium]